MDNLDTGKGEAMLRERSAGWFMSFGLLAAATVAAGGSSFNGVARAGEHVVLVEDFETENGIQFFGPKDTRSFSTQHATHGKRSLRIEGGEYLNSWRIGGIRGDWSGFDSFEIDVYYEGTAPVVCTLLIGDKAWQEKGSSYWNRHNGSFTIKPGKCVISIPVEGLYRGEAGSRNNDIKTNIDPASIIRLDLGFNDARGAIYLDNIRLVKSSLPDGIIAFDFGPDSQPMSPGFTPVSWNTTHGGGKSYGWHERRRPWGANAARDDAFPTKLYQDFVEAKGSEFIVDLPKGAYGAFLVYDDLGYWGGEHARHRRRTIHAEGRLVHDDNRGESGPREYLHHFEDTELHPGGNPWKTFMEHLFEPVRFEFRVTDDALNLTFDADAGFSSKVAALVLYPMKRRREAEKWLDELVTKQRDEFLDKAVEQPTPSEGRASALPAAVRQKGFATFVPDVSRDVYLTTVPTPKELDNSVTIAAARGEYEVATFAICPLRDLGRVRVELSTLRGPAGAVISGKDIDIRWVWHCAKRGFNSINYRIEPWSLRRLPAEGIEMPKGLTRQFWITIHAPENAPAGEYRGTADVRGTGMSEKISIALTVRPFELDETKFPMGFFGSRPPREYEGEERARVQGELLQLLRNHGMNLVAGPPAIELKGFDGGGKPQLELAETDAYMRLARAAGFREVVGYGGMVVQGLHGGYVVGAEGQKWAQTLGVSFTEVCKRVLASVQSHAEREKWLVFDYPLCDETRVRDVAEKQLELMRALREASPWLRTQGSYSVSFEKNEDPLLHQEFFKTLRVSYLNDHDQTVMDKAKEIGAEVRIYNQGRSRYTFGWYQWSEYNKGVTGRVEWHLLALHGYQWFDLDGREPDTAMINYGRDEVIPTIALARSREGVDDFRYCQTLHNSMLRAERRGGRARDIAKRVGAFLAESTKKIRLNDRARPEWLDQDAYRLRLAKAIEQILEAEGDGPRRM